jgi:hypothetical protein
MAVNVKRMLKKLRRAFLGLISRTIIPCSFFVFVNAKLAIYNYIRFA